MREETRTLSLVRETRPLEQVNQAIVAFEAGRIAARIALEPWTLRAC
jgi:hypothetical protein